MLRQIRDFLASHHMHRPRCTLGAVYSSAHFAYFTGVFFEGHGLYAWFGGSLAGLMIIGLLIGEEFAE